MDLELGEGTHDLVVNTSTGDLTILEGLDATAQRLKIKLLFFLGEWFLDQSVGIPYYESVLIKNPNLAVVNAIFRKAILTDEAVEAINQFELTIDSAARSAHLLFKADTVDGPLVFDQEMVI
jgi:hypothetical protein